ncbi:MAG: hypothetical protein K1000chlam2_01017 [Chlamydiae bacterium]|nr:hypothetical protein [Chlamydiota bacterium]
MSIPPSGPGAPTPPEPSKPIQPSDSKDAFLLNSPFAKMFKATGHTPTVKEIKAIIDGILKHEISEIKRQDAGWKKAMKKLKEAIEGNA